MLKKEIGLRHFTKHSFNFLPIKELKGTGESINKIFENICDKINTMSS